MSDAVVTRPASDSAKPSRRGQSLVEFALVLPMLLVLLLGIADFGRVFAAGITIEAAARDGAEAAAQEYVQRQRNDPGPLTADDYEAIRAVARKVACEEASSLPNYSGPGGSCTMPITAACTHDGGDLIGCGDASGYVPGQCDDIYAPWTAVNEQGVGALPYVEVRLCYRFSTFFDLSELRLPFGWGLSLGEIWLQRDRSFAAGDY